MTIARAAKFVLTLPSGAKAPAVFAAPPAPSRKPAAPAATVAAAPVTPSISRPAPAEVGAFADAVAALANGRRVRMIAKAFSTRTGADGKEEIQYRPKKRLDMRMGPTHTPPSKIPQSVAVHEKHMGGVRKHDFTFTPDTNHGYDNVVHVVHHNGKRIGRVSAGAHGAVARLDASQHTHRHARPAEAIHNMLHEHFHEHHAGEAKQEKMF